MDNEIIIDFCNDVTKNLLSLLEKKMKSLQITARCHEILANRYALRGRIVKFISLLISGLSLFFSTLGNNTNLPLAILSGVGVIVTGFYQVIDYTEKAKEHEQCRIYACNLADDIEFIILKNNHTKESLQSELMIYEERIKSFRRTEVEIPINVKMKAIRG